MPYFLQALNNTSAWTNLKMPNAQGKRRRSTEGAQGTNKGHENAEGMALVGVRLTAQLGHGPGLATLRFNPILERRIGCVRSRQQLRGSAFC